MDTDACVDIVGVNRVLRNVFFPFLCNREKNYLSLVIHFTKCVHSPSRTREKKSPKMNEMNSRSAAAFVAEQTAEQ